MTIDLPTVDYVGSITAHNDGLVSQAEDRFRTAFGVAQSSIARTVQAAANQHTDKADGVNAAAQVYERIAEAIQANGQMLVQSANTTGSSSDSDATHQVTQLEEKNRALEADRPRLEREAHKSSALQTQIDQLRRDHSNELTRLRGELEAARAATATPAPSSGSTSQQMLDDLRTRAEAAEGNLSAKDIDIRELKATNETLTTENANLQRDLNGAREQLGNQFDVVAWAPYLMDLEARLPDQERHFTQWYNETHDKKDPSATTATTATTTTGTTPAPDPGAGAKADPSALASTSSDDRSLAQKMAAKLTGKGRNTDKKDGK